MKLLFDYLIPISSDIEGKKGMAGTLERDELVTQWHQAPNDWKVVPSVE